MISNTTRTVSRFTFLHQAPRFRLPALLLGAFAIVALLYLLAPTAYFALLRFWGIPVYQFPFLDLHALLSALECKRQGVDVMLVNPCDVLGRPHVYSPLWLAPAALLPVQADWLMPAGVCLDLIFILSLYRLPAVTCALDRTILGLAALSPATVYALERSNNDLIIFLMIITAASLAVGSWPRRIGAYTIWLLAGLLKYYPLALLLILVREKPKRFWALAVAAILVVIIFYVWYRAELGENAVVLQSLQTSHYSDAFDFTNLPSGIVELVPQLGSWMAPFGIRPMAVGTVILVILLADCATRIWRINQDNALGASLAKLPESYALFFMIGATLIVGCFFAGRSVLYRAIFFLLTLPSLCLLARNAPYDVVRMWLRPCIGLILFLMWSEFFRNGLHDVITLLPPGRLSTGIEILFWAVKELIWWRVIAVFCGLLLQFVCASPSGRLLRNLPGFRPLSTP